MNELVQTQAEFERRLSTLRGESLLAVDTEAASFHRYLDRIYLIQISSRESTIVVDPLAVRDLALLGEALADPRVELVFHDADYDLRILDRDYGFRATHLFDTRIAAQLLNEPAIGLAALLEKYFGVRLDKKYQRADWSLRPLSVDMLQYAASDTRHLPGLRDALRDRLVAAGRWSWAEEEFRLLEQVRWTPTGPLDEAYLRLKGAKALKGRALLILKELHQWREATASALDRAPFRVMSNETMVAIAEVAPRDLESLRTIKGVTADVAARRGVDLLAAVGRGLQAPATLIPSVERAQRQRRDPEDESAIERLKVARNAAATRLEIAPGVLCPNGTLEAIVRLKVQSVEELEKVPELRRWQAGTIGKELVAALKKP